jgi:hypothetical protein
MRGSSEKTSRSLRPTKQCQAREEAIEAFRDAYSDPNVADTEEILIPVSRARARHLSDMEHPDILLFTPNPQTPILPIMPSPKDSVEGDSYDELEAHDNPRNLPPSTFISTPKCTSPSSASTLSSLTTLSASSKSSHKLPDTQLSVLPKVQTSPDKAESKSALPAPSSIRSRVALIMYAVEEPTQSQMQAQATPPPLSQPTLPTSQAHTTMATTTYVMPGRSSDKAPKFDGRDESLLIFIDEYKEHADQAKLLNTDRIKGLICYVPNKDRNLWVGMPKVSTANYDAFIAAVKEMYPGCTSDRRFTIADLQTVSCNQMSVQMTSIKAEGKYFHAFTEVAQLLEVKGRIGKVEMNRMFLEGFPTNIQQQMQQHLLIKFPDHHPNDPYPMKDVCAAARFLLPGIVSIAATITPVPVQSPSPQVITMQMPMYQQQAPGVVIKQEYQTTRSVNYTASGCAFCGAHDHFISRCWEKEMYISEGKCKIHESKGKIVLQSGDWVPGHPNEGTLKEQLNHYYTSAAVTITLALGGYQRLHPLFP